MRILLMRDRGFLFIYLFLSKGMEPIIFQYFYKLLICLTFYWFSYRPTINIIFSLIYNHSPHQKIVKKFVKKFVYQALLMRYILHSLCYMFFFFFPFNFVRGDPFNIAFDLELRKGLLFSIPSHKTLIE